MVKLPTEKQRRIVKAKVQGKKNRDIAKLEYPNAKLESQDVIVSRELAKPHVAKYYQESKLIALKNVGIDWQWIIDRINDAGNATKQNQFTGEIDADHGLRLRAAKQAQDLLEVKTKDVDQTAAPLNNLPAGIDEVQLIRLLKNR